jgi:amino acid permease
MVFGVLVTIEMGKSRNKVGSKTVVIVLGIICALLVTGLVGVIAISTMMIQDKSNVMANQDRNISDLQRTVLSLNNTLIALNKSNSLIRGIKITATPFSHFTILSEGTNAWGESWQEVREEARENVTLTLHNFGEVDAVAVIIIYTEVNWDFDYSVETILVRGFSDADITCDLRGTFESSAAPLPQLSYGYLILGN